MPRAIRQAMGEVDEAMNKVDDAAQWVSHLVSQINTIVDKIEAQGYLELEVDIPLTTAPVLQRLLKLDSLKVNLKIKVPK